MFYSPYTETVKTIEKLRAGEDEGLEAGSDVDSGGVVLSVA